MRLRTRAAVAVLAAVSVAGLAVEVAGPAAAATPAYSVGGCHTQPVLSVGSQGDCVAEAQYLVGIDYYATAVDGHFGSGTRASIVNFQRKIHLSADGVVGPSTWWWLKSCAFSYSWC